jgi:hypothetical protein
MTYLTPFTYNPLGFDIPRNDQRYVSSKSPRSDPCPPSLFFLFSVFKNSGDEVAEWRFGAGETPVVAFILGFQPPSGIKLGNLRITAIVSPNAPRSDIYITELLYPFFLIMTRDVPQSPTQ